MNSTFLSPFGLLPIATQLTTSVITPVYQYTPPNGKVYRLLRPDENPQFGLYAKNVNSIVTAAYHVAWGSHYYKKMDSKYISTCLTYDNARLIEKNNNQANGPIVSIDVTRAPVIMYHVWNAIVRQQLVEKGDDAPTVSNFKKFAEANNEVLLVGTVPPNCVTIEPRITAPNPSVMMGLSPM
ncbi:unnamed protein product [Mytilus coruscus]|uniref:Uncharacterized protein n=1 Tax=Mytilus coruscus TaxID=42192 RepID=A0A6J8ES13_MYTCO|nr:unnamed protein product [Mytilus coruscus]